MIKPLLKRYQSNKHKILDGFFFFLVKAEIRDLGNVAKNLYFTIFFHKYKNHINLHFY